MNLAKLTNEQVAERIGRLMDGFAMRTVIIGTNGIFRARIHPQGREYFENVAELWYPPKSAVEVAGRFNQAGDVRFYASSRIFAAILEVQPGVGDRVSLVVAASKRAGVHLNCTHIGLHKCKEELEVMGGARLNLQNDPDFQADLRTLRIEKKWRRLDDYFTELALTVPSVGEEQNLYKATNAIEALLGKINQHNAMIYPSVATDLNSFNLMLSPNEADEHFFGAEAWTFEITSHVDDLQGAHPTPGGFYGIQPIARSADISEGGDIDWVPAEPSAMFDLEYAIRRAGNVRQRRFG